MNKDNDPRGCSATDQQIVESCVCFDSCVHDPSPNLFISNEAKCRLLRWYEYARDVVAAGPHSSPNSSSYNRPRF